MNPLRLPPDRRREILADFSSRNEKTRDTGGITDKKRRGDSLDENRSVIRWRLRSATALGAVWYRYRLRGLQLGLRLVLFIGNE